MTVRLSTLGNGLIVATDPMNTVESVSLGVWVGVGTRNERAEEGGVSHLLEHMAFKGTARRSALDIATEIENVGGHINAYTSRETTAYFAKVLKDDAPLALDIVADILQHSSLAEDELERERAVVVQEIHQADDTPDDIVFDYFQETAFPDQPLGRPVLGRAEVVAEMRRETVAGYMQGHYTGAAMVLAASGNIDHDALVGMAETAFAELPAGTGPGPREAARYGGGERRVGRELEQAHLLLGFEGVAYEDKDYYAVAVLSTLFGGGMSSRLFQEVREKRGLAYSIYSFVPNYRDGGLFGIYAGTGADDLGRLTDVVLGEIAKLRDGVGDDETARAGAQLKASILMSLESSSSRAEQLARQIHVFGRPLTVEEIVANIEAVDTAAIAAAAARIFTTPPTIAALGPIAKLQDFEVIGNRLA